MAVSLVGVLLVLLGVASGYGSTWYFRSKLVAPAWIPGVDPSASPSPAASAGAGAPPTADTVTLVGVGDVTMGTLGVFGAADNLPPNDGAGYFDSVKSALTGDVVMGNLETPLTADTGYDKCNGGCNTFILPTSYAGILHDAGFTMLSLANNHTLDMGANGLANTQTALQSAGVASTGAASTATVVTVGDVKVAVLGFSLFAGAGSLPDTSTAVAAVKAAAQQADIVVVQMHAGAEGVDDVTPGAENYQGDARGDEVAFAHAMVDAGADVVIGHGPHVLRGMEFYQGRLIAYSLGNFTDRVFGTDGRAAVGAVLKLSLHKDGSWASGSLVATKLVGDGLPALDSSGQAYTYVNDLSTADLGSTGVKVGGDGSITVPTAG